MAPEPAVMFAKNIVPDSRFGRAAEQRLHSRLCVKKLAPLVMLGTILSGCAHYQASPLRPPVAVLGSPDLSLISADAQIIDRPYLTPEMIDLSKPLNPNALGILAVLLNPDLKELRAKT